MEKLHTRKAQQEGSRGLSDLPAELILDYVLPALDLKDVLAVSLLSRLFHTLANDEKLWRSLTLRDHDLDTSEFEPSSGNWSKRVYQGLILPDIYTWGSNRNSALGFDPSEVQNGVRSISDHYVSSPHRLNPLRWNAVSRRGNGGLEDVLARAASGTGSLADTGSGDEHISSGEEPVGVVDIQGGWSSCVALDRQGAVWFWGGLSTPGHQRARFIEPTRLLLPCKVQTVSMGTQHFLALDEDNLIWEVTSLSEAFYHTSPALTSPAQIGLGHIRQVSAGDRLSAALDSSGNIHVWNPHVITYKRALTAHASINHMRGGSHEQRSLTWGTVKDITETLPPVPSRPEGANLERSSPNNTNSTGRAGSIGDMVIEIACGENFVVARKANGEVWYKYVIEEDGLEWVYLSDLSYPDITHITAKSTIVISYSRSTVHSTEVTSSYFPSNPRSDCPTGTFRIGAEQNSTKSIIIQVEVGAFHVLALTSLGEVWSWGGERFEQNRNIWTKHDDIPPQRVSFRGHSRSGDKVAEEEEEPKPFVFKITAGIEHFGALILRDPSSVPGV